MKNIIKFFSLCLLSLCIDTYAQVPGTPYILPSPKNTCVGSLPGVTFCSGACISVTGCASISGASINDNLSTTGIEYNWSGATGYIASNTTTQALIEIGGQCWYRINADRVPSNFSTVPTWVNNSDVGWHGYYSGGPYTNEGRLYQWSAAMNGSTTERAQGICAPGFHIPSLCEYYYMASGLGVSAACLNSMHLSSSWPPPCGNLGSMIQTSSINYSPTNSSGFSILPTGLRWPANGNFVFRNHSTAGFGYTDPMELITSTLISGTVAWIDNDWAYPSMISANGSASIMHRAEPIRCVAD